jgi:hypothetical protein
MLLQIYVGVVGAGAIALAADHYKTKLKDVSLKFSLPKLSIPKLNYETLIKTVFKNNAARAEQIKASEVFENWSDVKAKMLNGQKPHTAPPPSFRNGGNSTSFAQGGGGNGGAGGVTSSSYQNAHQFENPMGLALLYKINTKYPWVQAILMQPNTYDHRDVLSLNLVWFNQAGKKIMGTLTVRYPDFQHVDMQHVDTELMFRDACTMIENAEEKPKPDANKQTYDYMTKTLNDKMKEIEWHHKQLDSKIKADCDAIKAKVMKKGTVSNGPR